MDSSRDLTDSNTSEPLLRLDRAHCAPAEHVTGAVLRSRRVRQVLVGADHPHRSAIELANDDHESMHGLCPDAAADTAADLRDPVRVIRQVRDNLATLTHIARDPLLCCAEQGAMLADVREAVCLTESALREVQAAREATAADGISGEAMWAIVHVIEQRVDRLFKRMDRLTGLRQAMFRLSAILERVSGGLAPRVHEVDELATMVVDSLVDDQSVVLLDPESTERSVRVAAHALNVAQVVARLTRTEPAWRDEVSLALSAALLQDLGMMQLLSEVLDSSNLLTPPQRKLVQTHPATSASIVRQMRGHDERLVDAIGQHHERMDGSGYPEHRRGDAVDSVARLLAVADSFVGIQSPRSYRPALSAAQALVEMDREAADGRLDPSWVARLPGIAIQWLKIPIAPDPPTKAPAISALAA